MNSRLRPIMPFYQQLKTKQYLGQLSLPSKKLIFAQLTSFLLLILQIFIIISCLTILVKQPHLKATYLLQISLIIFFLHITGYLFENIKGAKHNKVSADGNNWKIGNYSEKEVREQTKEATKDLPERYSNISINIVHNRSTSAWTFISLIWPNRFHKKNISISSGSLHYLTKNELKAIILHEIAHNLPQYRVNPFGNMLLTDIAIFSGVYIVSYDITSFWNIIALFVITRSLIIRLTQGFIMEIYKEVEHLCDYFSAKNLGKPHIINALLKMGEESELTDAVISLSAKRLLKQDGLDLEDIYYAFEDVRPYGRIFHNNLFKHASEVVNILNPDKEISNSKEAKNEIFMSYLKTRKEKRTYRIRWRSFDEQKKGFLSRKEIDELCNKLVCFPNNALVISEEEFFPTTHPKYRDRILFINNAIIY